MLLGVNTDESIKNLNWFARKKHAFMCAYKTRRENVFLMIFLFPVALLIIATVFFGLPGELYWAGAGFIIISLFMLILLGGAILVLARGGNESIQIEIRDMDGVRTSTATHNDIILNAKIASRKHPGYTQALDFLYEFQKKISDQKIPRALEKEYGWFKRSLFGSDSDRIKSWLQEHKYVLPEKLEDKSILEKNLGKKISEKEYISYINDFVEEEQKRRIAAIKDISSPDELDAFLNNNGNQKWLPVDTFEYQQMKNNNANWIELKTVFTELLEEKYHDEEEEWIVLALELREGLELPSREDQLFKQILIAIKLDRFSKEEINNNNWTSLFERAPRREQVIGFGYGLLPNVLIADLKLWHYWRDIPIFVMNERPESKSMTVTSFIDIKQKIEATALIPAQQALELALKNEHEAKDTVKKILTEKLRVITEVESVYDCLNRDKNRLDINELLLMFLLGAATFFVLQVFLKMVFDFSIL
ncbi:MAG: hypothetical protein ACTSUW_02380 [Candidatus Heimdallarchaeota archaeon]